MKNESLPAAMALRGKTGFVEGNDIFRNRADVIVCDGFIGNVALKTIEGVVKFVSQTVKISVHKNIFHMDTHPTRDPRGNIQN